MSVESCSAIASAILALLDALWLLLLAAAHRRSKRQFERREAEREEGATSVPL